jgi:predicted ATP-dependent endonuclease of OLD family
MIKTLLSDYSQNNNSDKKPAIFSFKQKNDCDFAGVISVAFSAFDDFVPMDESSQREKGFKYSYVGLKRTTNSGGKERGSPMSSRMLTGSFIKSFKNCLAQKKDDKLLEVLDELYSDPMFSENLRKTLTANNIQKNNCITELKTIYNKMSSGHRIVLLTITKLVEKVEEKTLILIDEPESHLHPPLLSALVRAISNLLTSKNGVAIIATHSPVVLQEVPNECVWKISRSGNSAKAERPKNETFGESIGILTSEIFGLEVTESGFHKLLKEAIQPNIPYEEALGSFNNKLGAEARIILRSLIANNKR